jgi:large subunit ribosomal protein L27
MLRFATNTSAGSSTNGRDSPGQRLGVKKFSSQHVNVSDILIKQRGTKFLPGENVGRARDDSLYALVDGTIKFTKDLLKRKTTIHVIPYPSQISSRSLTLCGINIDNIP